MSPGSSGRSRPQPRSTSSVAAGPDPGLRARLTPDYTMGCKRILGSSTYYPALQADNAELITDEIAEIGPDRILTADGAERKIDTIIWGTGFEVVDWPLGRYIRGRDGRLLSEHWGGTPEGYKGSAVTGFPNLFTLVGPNVGLGHNSMIYLIESQIAYMLDALRQMRDRRLSTVEVRPEAQRQYNEGLRRQMGGTVWMSGCQSWYMNDEGRIHTLWPYSSFRFRAELSRFDLVAYEAEPQPATPATPVSAPAGR